MPHYKTLFQSGVFQTLPLLKKYLPIVRRGGRRRHQQHRTIFCQVSVLVAYQLRCQLRCIHLGCLAEQRDDLVSWSLVVKFGNCYVRVLMSTCRQIDALENTKTDHTGFIIWHNTLHCTLWLWFHVHFWNGFIAQWSKIGKKVQFGEVALIIMSSENMPICLMC